MERIRKRSATESDVSETPRALRLKRRRPDPPPVPVVAPRDWNQWVAASSTRNFLIKDPLLDWLSYHSTSLIIRKPSYAESVIKASSTKHREGFTDFIMAQGTEFESKVIQYFYKRHGAQVIKDIGGNTNARSETKAQETIDAMNQGIPIIYQGVFHNPDNLTYGVPDLIIRSDWLKKIVEMPVIDLNTEEISAPLLENYLDRNMGKDKKDPPNYHYRIVDIKFSSLYLRADGIHLLNAGSIPAYKGQLYIYNKALARIQGYEPDCAYIMGRKWKYTSRKITYRGKSCVTRLGAINFADVDKQYVERTDKAIAWLKDMRQNGSGWTLGPQLPLCRPELYPNMSNPYDYPWRSVKREMADDIKEISNLWMCGVKNRNLAMEKGIYQWTDPRCTTEAMGVNGPKTKRVLDKIIDINRSPDGSPLVLPRLIQNNDEGWQTKQNLEFYVDFEFVNDVASDFDKMPNVEAKSIIFLIGVGYFELDTDKWIYKEFTVNALTPKEEYKICTSFSQYIREEADWWECPNPLLIHWSNAENWQWSNAVERHKSPKIWIPSKKGLVDGTIQPRWFDLLQIFRKEPIVIKGCLGFGLKEVARGLHKLGLITTQWDGDSSCSDGAGAMVSAFKAHKDSLARGISMKDLPLIKDIIQYNEVDCKVVGEIMNYLRNNHIVREDDVQIFGESSD